MLPKYFSIFRIITIICSLLATNTFQIASASQNSVKSIDRDKLTVKHKKEPSINVERQSEIKEIYKTLTQTYRGLNGCNVELVAKHVLMRGRYLTDLSDSCVLRRQGDLLLNYEVKNIELVSLSDNKATVNIQLVQTAQYTRAMKRPSIESQSISCILIKDPERWKVSNFFIKASVPVGEAYIPKF
jgi:hypothetical protein